MHASAHSGRAVQIGKESVGVRHSSVHTGDVCPAAPIQQGGINTAAADEPDIAAAACQCQRLCRTVNHLAALPLKSGISGNDDVPPFGQGPAAGEGVQRFPAHNQGAAGGEGAEALHVPRQGEQQTVIPANGPVPIHEQQSRSWLLLKWQWGFCPQRGRGCSPPW